MPRRSSPTLSASTIRSMARVSRAQSARAYGGGAEDNKTQETRAKAQERPDEANFQSSKAPEDPAFTQVLQEQNRYQQLGRRQGAWRRLDRRGEEPVLPGQDEQKDAKGESADFERAQSAAESSSTTDLLRTRTAQGESASKAHAVDSTSVEPARDRASSDGEVAVFNTANTRDSGQVTAGIDEDSPFPDAAQGSEDTQNDEKSSSIAEDSRFAQIADDPLGLMSEDEAVSGEKEASPLEKIANDPLGLLHEDEPQNDPLGLLHHEQNENAFSFGLDQEMRAASEDPFGLLQAMQERFDPAAEQSREAAFHTDPAAAAVSTNVADPRLVQLQEMARVAVAPALNVDALGDSSRATAAYQRQLPENANRQLQTSSARIRAQFV